MTDQLLQRINELEEKSRRVWFGVWAVGIIGAILAYFGFNLNSEIQKANINANSAIATSHNAVTTANNSKAIADGATSVVQKAQKKATEVIRNIESKKANWFRDVGSFVDNKKKEISRFSETESLRVASKINSDIQSNYERQNERLLSRIVDLENAINERYLGFSYYTFHFRANGGDWQNLICDQVDFNTFDLNSYNQEDGVFVTPISGFYRFTTNGLITTEGTGNERIAVGIAINDTLKSFSGGQFSSVDTPGPQYSFVVELNRGDKISVRLFVPKDAVIGSQTTGHEWWFQGEYLGI